MPEYRIWIEVPDVAARGLGRRLRRDRATADEIIAHLSAVCATEVRDLQMGVPLTPEETAIERETAREFTERLRRAEEDRQCAEALMEEETAREREQNDSLLNPDDVWRESL